MRTRSPFLIFFIGCLFVFLSNAVPTHSQTLEQTEGCKEALGTVTDTLHDDVITRLRQRYLDDREHVAQWTDPLLHTYQLSPYQPSNCANEFYNNCDPGIVENGSKAQTIVDELQRIAQTYKSDYEIAKAREDSLRASLTKQVQEAGASGSGHGLLSDLQLQELNSQMISATAATAEAKARLERVEQVRLSACSP
jgi:hypothetical protein